MGVSFSNCGQGKTSQLEAQINASRDSAGIDPEPLPEEPAPPEPVSVLPDPTIFKFGLGQNQTPKVIVTPDVLKPNEVGPKTDPSFPFSSLVRALREQTPHSIVDGGNSGLVGWSRMTPL